MTAVQRANTLSSDNKQFVKQGTPSQLFVVALEKGEKKTKVYNSNGKSHLFLLSPISISTSPFVVSPPFIFRGNLVLFRNGLTKPTKSGSPSVCRWAQKTAPRHTMYLICTSINCFLTNPPFFLSLL